MKRGWKIHAAVYAVVMTGLTILNLVLAAQTEDDGVSVTMPPTVADAAGRHRPLATRTEAATGPPARAAYAVSAPGPAQRAGRQESPDAPGAA